MLRRVWLLVVLAIVSTACSGGNDSPSTPTPVAQTRILRLAGNLNFGNVIVGQEPPDGLLAVSNDGTATLNVSGLTGPTGPSTSPPL